MAGYRTTSLALLVATVGAAGCLGSSDPTPDRATPGRNGRGEFFRWDPLDDPAEQELLPLAVDADAFLGHSTGTCVESLLPHVAASTCGRVTGRDPGTTVIAAVDARGRVVDWLPLAVLRPTAFTIHARVSSPSGGWYAGRARVPPGGWLDIVVELEANGTALLGRADWDATVRPEGALSVEGYGRYIRADCLRSGVAELTIHEPVSDTATRVTVDCLNVPPDGWGEP